MAPSIFRSSIARSALFSSSVLAMAIVAGGNPTLVQPDAAMSCFTIGGEVTCFPSANAQAQPVPPIMAPIGPIFGGEDEEIIMRDNGGYVVERG